jgi:two-component system, LytTR family, response regulator
VRALIVDDEPLARRGVASRLRKLADVVVVGECGDGLSAVEKILELSPDVVFLDIQMPGMDGFDVLNALPPESLPAVIFLTAYEQHALRAFEVHALDYLLKPASDERFNLAVRRARELMDGGSRAVMAERILHLLEQRSGKYIARFTVRTGVKIEIVLAEEVEWIGGAGDYAELHTRGRARLVRESLNALEQKLDPSQFLRIHRSRIVRLECIRELRTLGSGEYIAKLADGTEHRSGRTYADRLESWLSSGQS